MIEIRISDPYTTPAEQLRAVANFLTAIAEDKPAAVHGSAPSPAAVRTIDPADNPAAGVSPSEVFAQAEPTAAQVFGGNATAAPAPSIAGAAPSSTAHAATLAISTNPTASVTVAPPPGNVAQIAAPPAPPANHAPGVELDKNGLPWDGRIHSETKSKNKDMTWRNRRGVDPAIVASVEAELRAAMGAPGNAPPASYPPHAPAAVGASSSAAIAGPAANVPPPPAATVTAPVGSTATTNSAPAVVPPAPTAAASPAPVAAIPAAPASTATVAAPSVPNVPAPPANGAPAASTAIPTAPATNPVSVGSVEGAPAQSMTFPMLAPKITAGLGAGTLTQAQVTQALATVGLPTLPMLINRPDLVPTVAALLGLA